MAKVRVPKAKEQPEQPEAPVAEPAPVEPTAAEQAANVLDTPTAESAEPEAASEQPEPETIPATLETEEPNAETIPTSNKSPDELAKQAWKQKLSSAKDEYIEAAIHRKQVQDELKAAKETEKEALATVQRLIERGPEKLPLFDGQSSVTPPASGETSGTSQPLPADQDGWRKVAMTELPLDTIKGLGDKKRDALLDVCPTLGAFEDKRVEAGASGVDTVLPKGIGKAITDPLEEMHLNYITNWGNRPQAASPADDSMETIPDAKQWEAMTDEQQHDWRQARAAQISESADFAEKVKELEASLPAAYQSGSVEYGRDGYVKDCPYVPGEEMDQWLYGYFAAAKEDDSYSGEEVEPPADDESDDDSSDEGDTEEPTLSMVGSSIDDL